MTKKFNQTTHKPHKQKTTQNKAANMFLTSPVQDPPAPEVPRHLLWPRRCHRRRLQLRHPGVPHRRGPRAGGQCLKGPKGEEDHSATSAARHQRRRGAGHPDQGDHRRRGRHPPHPQVAHREEGRGSPAASVGSKEAQPIKHVLLQIFNAEAHGDIARSQRKRLIAKWGPILGMAPF